MNADTLPGTPIAGQNVPVPKREPSKGPTPNKAKAAKKPAPKGKIAKKAAKVKGNGAEKSTNALAVAAKTYHRDAKVKTAKGSVSVDCNDKTAKDLRGRALDDVYKIAARTLKEPEADLRKKYKHLNEGMQRMNLGNRMRAAQ